MITTSFEPINNGYIPHPLEETKTTNRDCGTIISQTCSLFYSLALLRNINFRTSIPTEIFYLNIEREKLELLIIQLLNNAFKYSGQNGSIEVIIDYNKTNSDFVSITITDTGTGIAPTHIPHIFKRFYRIKPDGTGDFKGTNIGLSIVKKIIDDNKGNIEIHSRPNKGSSFKVTLPTIKKADEYFLNKCSYFIENLPQTNQISEHSYIPKQIRKHNESALIVDSNFHVRYYISDKISLHYNCLFSNNYSDAIKKTIQFRPDIIITDIFNPKKEGLKIIDMIKNNKTTCHIPIIILSENSSYDAKLEIFNSGADDYIFKPFQKEELLIKIQNLLATRRQLKKKYENSIDIWKTASPATDCYNNLLLKKLTHVFNKNLSNMDNSLVNLSIELGMSERNYRRKIKALTGKTPSKLFLEYRLLKVVDLLKENLYSLTEISSICGFADLSHLSKSFKKQYGLSPNEFRINYSKAQNTVLSNHL